MPKLSPLARPFPSAALAVASAQKVCTCTAWWLEFLQWLTGGNLMLKAHHTSTRVCVCVCVCVCRPPHLCSASYCYHDEAPLKHSPSVTAHRVTRRLPLWLKQRPRMTGAKLTKMSASQRRLRSRLQWSAWRCETCWCAPIQLARRCHCRTCQTTSLHHPRSTSYLRGVEQLCWKGCRSDNSMAVRWVCMLHRTCIRTCLKCILCACMRTCLKRTLCALALQRNSVCSVANHIPHQPA